MLLSPTWRDVAFFLLQYWECVLVGSAICLVFSAVRLHLTSLKKYNPNWQYKR